MIRRKREIYGPAMDEMPSIAGRENDSLNFSKLHRTILASYNVYIGAIFFISLLCTLYLAIFDPYEAFDSCAFDRFENPHNPWQKAISSSLSYLTFFSLYFALAQTIVWPASKLGGCEGKFAINWHALFGASYAVVWYMSSYWLCHFLKTVLEDKTCSTHYNSVSGHYNFHLFFMFTFPWLLVRLRRDPRILPHFFHPNIYRKQLQAVIAGKHPHPRRLLLIYGTYGVFVLTSIAILARTWILGFHSVRQIAYGVLLALLSHWALTVVVSLLIESISVSLLLIFMISSLVSLGKVDGGHHINPWEFTYTVLLSLVLVLVSGDRLLRVHLRL